MRERELNNSPDRKWKSSHSQLSSTCDYARCNTSPPCNKTTQWCASIERLMRIYTCLLDGNTDLVYQERMYICFTVVTSMLILNPTNKAVLMRWLKSMLIDNTYTYIHTVTHTHRLTVPALKWLVDDSLLAFQLSSRPARGRSRVEAVAPRESASWRPTKCSPRTTSRRTTRRVSTVGSTMPGGTM